MSRDEKFHSGWEPTLEEERLLAEGTWWYDGTVAYAATLKRRRFDYTSDDLEALEAILDPINLDYVDFAINPEGELYVWLFEGPAGASESKSLSTLAEAKAHIASLGRVEIRWRDQRAKGLGPIDRG